ncbi:hypothetical protein [Flavobacterium branchiophilum]|uniref:Uncharacterized protein n=1 Tax=Flavobacterium branchiophilum TaxID=55197 RepID=A0A2H3KS52_9FLAO|nr:hypothetical protein [Flavobacterium branchiophilum]PDS24949.1 hypothetical protein B0A77_06745 [Flavobacterium branchiophilum]
MNKGLAIGLSIITFLILVRLFFGVHVDDEFGDKSIFVKHRPTWKWKFYSPIGMSDLKMDDLTKEKQIEEKYYDEFVRNNK